MIFWILILVFQGTLEEGTEGKQYLVAIEWAARRSEPAHHVHFIPSRFHCGNPGPNGPHIPVLRASRDLSNTQSLCDHMERREFPSRGDAEAGRPEGEEETGDEAHSGSARPYRNGTFDQWGSPV